MKKLLFFLGFLFLIGFISSTDYLSHQQNKNLSFSITSNFASSCTLSNINTPNGTITINQVGDVNGQTFSFLIDGGNYSNLGIYCHNIVCTDGTDTTSGYDCREINLSGVQQNMTLIIADIFLILTLSILIILLHNKYKNISYKDTDRDVAESHNGNWGKTFINNIGKNLMRNSFLWYYSLGWLILIVLKDLIYNFNGLEIYNFFILVLNIYSFGFFFVIIVWIGILIKHFQIITEIINDLNLGVDR